jgi:hypothetical protein
MAIAIKRDLYTEVTARILAELERGAAPWVKPLVRNARAKRPPKRSKQSPLLRMVGLTQRDCMRFLGWPHAVSNLKPQEATNG